MKPIDSSIAIGVKPVSAILSISVVPTETFLPAVINILPPFLPAAASEKLTVSSFESSISTLNSSSIYYVNETDYDYEKVYIANIFNIYHYKYTGTG
mgnify:CR=1 FL=1